ncbi:hypothetical protein PG984_005150 [Apiospora sp. TS-2023a]
MGNASSPTWSTLLTFLEIRWNSGDTEYVLETLFEKISNHLYVWSATNDDEWAYVIALTNKYVEYCEQFKAANMELYSHNYLNLAKDIPHMKFLTDTRQHLDMATMDKNIRYLEWFLDTHTEQGKTADIMGNTLLHIACQFTPRDSRGGAIQLLLDQELEIPINRQNISGETALHCFCVSVSESLHVDQALWTTPLLTTLLFLISDPKIDVTIRNYVVQRGRYLEGGKVASDYLGDTSSDSSSGNSISVGPFLACFRAHHPNPALS